MKKVVLDIVANLVSSPNTGYGTPVDTGWARTNWVPGIGTPPTGTAGSREAAEAGILDTSMQQRGLAEVAAAYKLNQGSIFISNNVPYIVLLNEGSSAQAPAGFVQNAIMKAIEIDSRRGLPPGAGS